MSSPDIESPVEPPPPADTVAAKLRALDSAETERKLRASRGRRSAFLFLGDQTPQERSALLGI